MLYGLTLLLVVAAALTGCRRASRDLSTPVPTATATPRSTPLPPVPTAIPPGNAENPLRMVVVPATTGASAHRAAATLESLLTERTGQAFEVVLADRHAEALAALCDSVGGAINVAWLDGMTYAAADAQGCGSPVFQVERRAGRASQSGEVIVLVAGEDSNVNRLADVGGETTLCRVGHDDLSTWLMPMLMLRTGGVDVISEVGQIVDYEDTALLLEAVAAGDCDVAGVPQSAMNDARRAVRDRLVTLGESPAMPFSILMYPVEMPLGLRTALDEAMTALSADPEAADALDDLLRLERLAPVEASDLAPVRAFVADAGLDLAALGG